MIFGIGTDIIEVDRMRKHLEGNDALTEKLFTEGEKYYCESGNVTKWQRYAARFSAKEAFFKALGTGYRFGMAFHEIEVKNDDLGKPYINPHGEVKKYIEKEKVKVIHLTISHVKEMVNAFVILEK